MRLIDADEVEREYLKLRTETERRDNHDAFCDGLFLGMVAVLDIIKKQPTVTGDTLKRRAKWELVRKRNLFGYTWYKCSSCGIPLRVGPHGSANNMHYCAECGAKMERVKR